MDVLPKDLLTEILLRLPTLTLVVTAKRVCRQWNSIISNPSFAKSQLLDRHIDHKDNSSLIYHRDPSDYHKGLIMYTDTGDITFIGPKGILPERRFCYKLTTIACNGLILQIYFDRTVVKFDLCNPIINQCVSLKAIKGNRSTMYMNICFGFGFDHITNMYKVIMITNTTSDVFCSTIDVLSEKKTISSWRRLGSLDNRVIDDTVGDGKNGVFFNGRLIWSLRDTNKKFLFDLHTEEFSFEPFEITEYKTKFWNEHCRLGNMMLKSSVVDTFLSRYPYREFTFVSTFEPCLLHLLPNKKSTYTVGMPQKSSTGFLSILLKGSVTLLLAAAGYFSFFSDRMTRDIDSMGRSRLMQKESRRFL